MKSGRGSHYTQVAIILLIIIFAHPIEAQMTEPNRTVHLGQKLFFDRSFSRHKDLSCASCHQLSHAFSDNRPVAVGSGSVKGTRNTPSLLDLGEGPYFWDGRTETLEAVVTQPFTNAAEMGLSGEVQLLERVSESADYKELFKKSFADSGPPISMEHIKIALATYVRSIRRGSSPYDQFVDGTNRAALSPQATRGLTVFREHAGCAECHKLDGSPAKFTDGAFHSTLLNPKLAPELPAAALSLSNRPATQLGTEIESNPLISELGRYIVTREPRDIASFRTPSLRNVALTAPYMHDGSVSTLRQAVDREIYYRNLQNNRPNTLTEQDRQDLVAFLESLSDVPTVR